MINFKKLQVDASMIRGVYDRLVDHDRIKRLKPIDRTNGLIAHVIGCES